ncbi:redoxin domain-containing protein [Clostridium sp.]|uniref:redoxin domain-containing protein n=1 Tax=Clostridium sp. TaxID=1506 RepID=UPI002FCBEAE4
MTLIKIGDVAPDFSLKDNHGQPVHLSDFKGKKVLLSWHPLAWTPVCTDQMRALESNWEQFEKHNTVALGFSVDPAPSKKVWSVALGLKNLRIPSDFFPLGKVTKDYGLFIEEMGMSQRANVLVDENGIVKWVKVYPMSQLPDINEVISQISNI